MPEGGVELLTHWESFCVITGSSAAVLIGLQFVVIVLGAEMNRGTTETTRAFGTPTIVHFCSVLLVATVLCAPWSSLLPVAVLLGLCGLCGLLYGAVLVRAARSQSAYTPVLEDWICHFTLPPLAYAALLLAGTMLPSAPETALFILAAAVLVLLFDGIHNAWDAVTFIAVSQRRAEEKPQEQAGK